MNSSPIPLHHNTAVDQSERLWYVLRTMPRHERTLATLLTKKGIEHYLPEISRKRKWSDRIKLVHQPLFPGYLFIKIHYKSEYIPVLSLAGSVDFIKRAETAVSISEGEIQAIRYLVEQGQNLESNAQKKFPPGQRVQIHFGPLKGHTAIVRKIKNKTRIYITYQLFNRTISAELDIADLERVVE
ncbi:MAG: UpxY family transcription antiterminator [Leptospiraceae bacterium]|nr:UpxY family transcription antiterminator [Leptospiraceae bacterium]